MSQSPYTPPASDLSKPNRPWPVRPQAVTWAAWAVFLDCVLGLLYLFPGIAPPGELSEPDAVIFAMIFIILIIGVLVWGGMGILKGKSGARWTVLAYFALSLFLTVTMAADPTQTIVRKVVDGCSLLMEISAMVLLSLNGSRRWFKACKALQ